jgi:hypothetical protein
MQPYADEETFHQLCMLLSLPKLTEHSQYRDWTVHKGRLHCFQQIRKLFGTIYQQQNETIAERRKAPQGRLIKLCKDAFAF